MTRKYVRIIKCFLALLIAPCLFNCSPISPVKKTSKMEASARSRPEPSKSTLSRQSGVPTTDRIVIDQIGYRTQSDKWFMIKNPRFGYDAKTTYVPGKSVQLRRASDNSVVKEIVLSPWNGGKVDEALSGDQVWQGEFSEVKTPGTYHIYDNKNKSKSYDFEIGDHIYSPVLTASVKSFFFQRSNVAIIAKHGGQWIHGLDHAQQKAAHLYNHSRGGDQGVKTARDISGGWFDAGDFRKYTSWMAPIIWDLAYAYEWYPDGFSDATGIPGSGNGVPDILDEIKIELDWLLKMQRNDGGLYSGCFVVKGIPHRNGEGKGDPSTDDRPYFYADVSTAATSSGAASFAIAARIFSAFDATYPGYAKIMQKAAENSWAFLKAHPKNVLYDHTNFDNADANKDDGADKRLRVLVAAELFRLTNKKEYQTYFEQNYNHRNTTDKKHQPILNDIFDTGKSGNIQRGLVSYCFASQATQSVVSQVKSAIRNGIEGIIIKRIDQCPYKAYIYPDHYHWGSNGARAGWANIVQYGIALRVNPQNLQTYRRVAEEHLHYFHGRNATGYCYLTQCQLFGADRPITQLYHTWFHDGTSYDTNPAPGFLSGGPNRYFKPAASSEKLVPPQDQPPMKSYKDWNTSWPENAWEISENQTSYQSKHVLLTAAFAGRKR